ncbi:MAG: cytochrome family [Solirubrobacteraceae bacterium]|nr:cytochrome family [Solirubrobacteraceae bacterium]
MDAALPPGPRAPRAAQMAAWLARPGWFAEQCRSRFGDVFTLRVEERPWVVLGDPADVREVFTAPDDVMHGGEANLILQPTLGAHSVMLLDEAAHLRRRRLMLPAFHGDRLARHRGIMVEATERAMAHWRPGERIALRPYAQAITLEVIVRAVFGVEDGRPLERVRALLAELLDRLTRPRRLFLAAYLGPHHPLMLALSRRELAPVDAELHRLIRERREAPDLAGRDDILSMLLLARDEAGGGLSDAELRDELMTLLVAGHETTANSLAWAFERLARTPGALDRVAGDDAYAEAAVRETLRLRPVIALVARCLTRDVELAGRRLPAGAMVAPCVLLVHRRPDVYPDPDAFRPERFLEQPPGTYTWIPFGGGVRRCLGASFAQMELQVVLQTIAARVRLEPVGAAEPVRRRAITLVPARGGEMRVAGARLPVG